MRVAASTSTHGNLDSEVKEPDRTAILLHLLDHNREELVFWRTRNWQALQASVVTMAALASVTILKTDSQSTGKSWLLGWMVFAVATLHGFYQKKNHDTYLALRADRDRILRGLGARAKGAFLPEEALVGEPGQPSTWGSNAFTHIAWCLASSSS